jgi:alpha-amylase
VTAAPPLAFCFGVHDHQPVGNFDGVVQEATERAYRPFLELVRDRRDARLTVHCTGSLLAWLREHARATFDLLGAVVADGRLELLTGGFYEPILAVLPDADKQGQIQRLTEFLKVEFGVRPRGMWLAERVWEPHLPGALRAAGVEYVLLDDSHFALAGLDPDGLGGYYLTEDQGATLAVFPISQRLRYLIPFAEVARTLEYLASRRGVVPAVTVVDDGEKFGVWPGTHEHVYRDGWLERFFDAMLGTPWLSMATFADVLDRTPAAGRVYLPAASYREMGEWALSAEAAEALERARRDIGGLEDVAGLLRGGFWRGFLRKYPEVADTYWKMLRLSRSVHAEAAARPGDARVLAAREALWRGQANDAYWHGVFGGCYLPHLRRAVKSALLTAEAALDGVVAPTPALHADVNGDGATEVLVRTSQLAVTVNPASGGSLTELAFLPRALDLADVLTRRREAYHARVGASDAGAHASAHTIHEAPGHKERGLAGRLTYDAFRRASLLDGWFAPGEPLDAVHPWPSARAAHGQTPLRAEVERGADGARVTLRPEAGDAPWLDAKLVSVTGAAVRADYRLTLGEAARWAVQWNLALTAGVGPDRYLTLPGRPSLDSSGRTSDVESVTLVDEWIGVEACLSWSPDAELAWGPVETISVSEAGFERLYQGLALLLTWPMEPGSAGAWTSLDVRAR